MSLPTPWTVGVRRFMPGATDAHGNPADVWAEPVPLPVHSIAPGAMVEPDQPNRDVSRVEFTLHAPAHPNMPTEHDLVRVDGVDHQVEGMPRDFTRGPWLNPVAGWVVELSRSEG